MGTNMNSYTIPIRVPAIRLITQMYPVHCTAMANEKNITAAAIQAHQPLRFVLESMKDPQHVSVSRTKIFSMVDVKVMIVDGRSPVRLTPELPPR
jgi:hypothetical protein